MYSRRQALTKEGRSDGGWGALAVALNEPLVVVAVAKGLEGLESHAEESQLSLKGSGDGLGGVVVAHGWRAPRLKEGEQGQGKAQAHCDESAEGPMAAGNRWLNRRGGIDLGDHHASEDEEGPACPQQAFEPEGEGLQPESGVTCRSPPEGS